MNYHLVVLVHGLWGSADHMEYLRKAILANNPPTESSTVVVLVANSFALYYTYDGIDVCGARVASEVIDQIALLEKPASHKVTSISVVGYSLGGLIARYAIGLLHSYRLFDTVNPHSFTTFASPHVGVLALGRGPVAFLYNAIAPYVLSYTSRQLCLVDRSAVHGGVPLLEALADPSLTFFQGLARFNKRVAYGNIVNDHRTEWYTTAMTVTDPYAKNVQNIAGPYVLGYEPVVINTAKGVPLEVLTNPSTDLVNDPTHTLGFVRRLGGRVVRWTVALVKVTVVVPVWFVAFVANAAFQTVVSAARKRQFLKSSTYAHFGHLAVVLPDDLTIPQKLHEEAGSALDSVMDAVKHEHGETSGVALRRQPTHNEQSLVRYLQQFTPACAPREGSTSQDQENQVDPPRGTPVSELNLRPVHRRIIGNLNLLAWEKFPVHIAGAAHTHAAIIVRYASPEFEEGKVVVEHWIRQVFVD
ncbi:uncharacterized protein SAPINGB_P000426 [Magnusiomyces paraingens]|uniref:DUF676 domain-containing protein n=1 Tax=Magnusiomyces paraingens TaxID=2606893 RepID=A0A5E8AZL8_9ASCO|nr:uncharacterized protein SAPINGB_P000426 [Saprochaete ingens]VVT44467.1 unnamed protein product [Saprochaete ingens]